MKSFNTETTLFSKLLQTGKHFLFLSAAESSWWASGQVATQLKQCSSLNGCREPAKDTSKSPNPTLRKRRPCGTTKATRWPLNCLARPPASLPVAQVPGNGGSESCSRRGSYWGRPGPARVSVSWRDWVDCPGGASPAPAVSGGSTWAQFHCGNKKMISLRSPWATGERLETPTTSSLECNLGGIIEERY